MSLNNTQLSALLTQSIYRACTSLLVADRIEAAYKGIATFVSLRQFWVVRSEGELSEHWAALRSDTQLFNTFIRAFNIFRFCYELDSERSFQELMGQVIDLQLGLSFTSKNENGTITDEDYQSLFQDDDDYQLMMNNNGWFVFLLILEMVGWTSQVVDAPIGQEKPNEAR